MPVNRAAENAFGIIGTLCWTIQLIPQIIKSYREKSTKGLSQILVFLWGVSGIPLGIYAIVQNLNIPLIVQPQLFLVLCLASWAQCQYYGVGRSARTAILMWVGVCAASGAFEAAMVFSIKPVYKDGRGNHAPVTVFGVVAAVMISGALIPQYYEIYKHREVIGISMIFMTVDMMGGVFNLLSLVFKSKLDILATIAYTSVAVLDGVVIILYLVLNPIARRRRRRLAAAHPEAAPSTPDPENALGGPPPADMSLGHPTTTDDPDDLAGPTAAPSLDLHENEAEEKTEGVPESKETSS